MRWFTRGKCTTRYGADQRSDSFTWTVCCWAAGEFSTTSLLHEGSDAAMDAGNEFVEGVGRGERLLGPRSSIYSFTVSFREIAIQLTRQQLQEDAVPFITIDGGPHTLWW